MKILVTGATGLVGTALVEALGREGHMVCRLLRAGSKKREGAERGFDVEWNPETGELGGAGVGPDAVVNLAGAPIADGRWTEERKKLLHSSRIDTTRALVKILAEMNARPRVLVSASACGIYGDRGDELLSEESKPGRDFLSELALEWEAEAVKAEALGIRVVLPRFGIILAREGGALPQMMKPFRVGLGGKLGNGQQWMSWVALEDVIGILRMAIESSSLRGAVNVVAPEPVRNVEFTKILARAIDRPAIFTAPAFALRLALGEMADALLGSQRVTPHRAEQNGYQFRYSQLEPALAEILKAQ
ncbi:MAG TPA: TIGR01777 family oxidoreductase [Candidatus Saccharimonadales bacterium]|nr:TIGR01777 family oxidoreductase [Candidatus Saccharimonadales bacterium]